MSTRCRYVQCKQQDAGIHENASDHTFIEFNLCRLVMTIVIWPMRLTSRAGRGWVGGCVCGGGGGD